MKKILFMILFASVLHSCDMKDKNGNAPLIEDANGNLIDNPAFESEQDDAAVRKRKEDVKHYQKSMNAWADSAVAADKEK